MNGYFAPLRQRRSAIAWLAILAAAAPPAWAAACADTPSGQRILKQGVHSFSWDNDIVFETDRYYSGGLRMSWTSPPLEDDDLASESGCYYGWVSWLNRGLDRALDGDEAISRNMSVTFLGHEVYTPADPNRTDLIVNDRPYAGWLYFGYGYNVRKSDPARNRERLDSIEARIGIVGPSAGAEWLTRKLHDLTNSDVFLGWDNQLHDEIAFAIRYERRTKADQPRWRFGNWYSDLIWHYGGAIGTLATYVNAGAELRLGRHLPDDFSSSPRYPGNISPTSDSERYFTQRGWYLFASVDARAVARDLFLDGNTFRASHHVGRETAVGEVSAGLVTTFRRTWRIGFSLTAQTKSFETQDDAHEFASVVISKELQ